jgi:hypothetical protein
VTGATVTIFAAGPGIASTLGSGATDSNGNFKFSFSNPGGNSVLYATARGGASGQGTNPAIAMLAVLGTAATFAPSVILDEITTVVSVWSMAQFIQPDGSISGPSPGLQEGAATVPSLANLATGQLADSLNERSKLTSLANVLVPCANSTGPSSANCQNLFQAATLPKAAAATDTLAAAVNIAQHPLLNIASLFTISQSDPAYGSGLSSPPPAWTVSVSHGGAGMFAPVAVAVDSQGNIWIANFDGSVGLSKLRPGGVPDPASPFLDNGQPVVALAIDGKDHVWSANRGGNTVGEVDSNGNLLSPADGYPTMTAFIGQRNFDGIAVDSSGNLWLTDEYNNSLIELGSDGALLSPPHDFRGGGIFSPVGIAIDGQDTKWIANNFLFQPPRVGSVSAFNSSGRPISPKRGYTNGGVAAPVQVAVDLDSNVWVSDGGYLIDGHYNPGAATKFSRKGRALSPRKGYRGAGIISPGAIAVDGSGNAWVLSDNSLQNGQCHLSELSPSGAPISPPITGYSLDGYCDAVQGLAIDSAGNLWMGDAGVDTVIEMVGAATPVKTPIIGPVTRPGS